MNYLNSRLSLWILTFFAVLFVVFLAIQPKWSYHLQSDTRGFYYPRLVFFLDNFSFANYQGNEYFPGAMFFFLLPGVIFLFFENNYSAYLVGLFIVNIFLVLLHLIVYHRYVEGDKPKDYFSSNIFLLILLSGGPLFLFRHDLFVTLFVLLSILVFNRGKRKLSFFLLGLATSIKIYPVLILPYCAIVGWRNDGKKMFVNLLFYLCGLLTVVGAYLLLSSGVSDLILPLSINSIKPVHVESLWGSLLTIISWIANGYPAPGLGANGIFGIHPSFIYMPLFFYNYFWLFPLGLFYIYAFKKQRSARVSAEIIFLIVLGFEIFSKILTGQYLYWFLALFPFLSLPQRQKYIAAFFCLLIAFLTQYIYPLHYNELLGSFYHNGGMPFYFYVLLTRNLLLVALLVQVTVLVIKRKNV